MAPSDEQLMNRAGRGDLTALGELFDRHRPAIFAFLFRFLGDRSMAEDAAQEVFLRVWRHRGTFDGWRGFTTWVYTVARHVGLDAMRKSGRATPLSQLSEVQQQRLDAAEDPALGPEQAAGHAALRDQVRRAQSLPPDQRLCLILKEYEGHSYREIGQIVGCSEGNARVMAHRGRVTLRSLLKSALEPEIEASCV